MYGITSINAVQTPNRSAYRSAPSTSPVVPRIHMPTPALAPITSREDHLAPDVAPQRALDPLRERRAVVRAGSGGRSPPRAAACRAACRSRSRRSGSIEKRRRIRERGALRERDRVLGVPRDLARAERVDPVVDCSWIWMPSRPWSSSQAAAGRCPARRPSGRCRVLLGDVVVDPLGRRSASGRRRRVPSATISPMSDGDEERRRRPRREPARQPQPLQVAHERVEQERDHRRGEEEEEHVPERAARA